MRTLVLVFSILLSVWMAASVPMDRIRSGVKSVPHLSPASGRPVPSQSAVKGGNQPLEFNVNKGEYVCGNRICKLRPGQEVKGCNGMCQYPIL